MSWINDVRNGLRDLDISKRNLQKFAFVVGLVLLIITLWMTAKDLLLAFRYFLSIVAFLLLLAGLLLPKKLSLLYKIWMGLAIAVGWWISRILLILFFYFIITPIGLIARLVGKQFMDVDMKHKKQSYWVNKEIDSTINYEKMY